jgi:hypothetical protein
MQPLIVEVGFQLHFLLVVVSKFECLHCHALAYVARVQARSPVKC